MSTVVMAICWPLQMPPTPKAVLISLADNANDHGECWPSIPTICLRTCFSERAVQSAIKWLEDRGALKADRSNGRHSRYCVTPNDYQPPQEVHPRISSTPAANASTPADPAGDPRSSRTEPPQEMPSNRKEPSRTVSKATVSKGAPSPAVAKPDDVDDQTWGDWLTLRKAKKAPVTGTVLREAIAEAGKAGVSLTRFLEIWCARGSQGLQAEWLKPNELAQARAGPSNQGPTSRTRTAIETLQGMKAHGNLDTRRDSGRTKQAALPKPGAHASG